MPAFLLDWQYLVRFFNVKLLRLLVPWFALVPVFLHSLRDIPKQFLVNFGEGEFILYFSLPFNWWFLWLSSFFYIMGWILYEIRCPSFVKRHQTYTQYMQYQHSPRWIIWEIYHAIKDNSDANNMLKRLVDKELATEDQSIELDKTENISIPNKGAKETSFNFSYKGKTYYFGMGPYSNKIEELEKELFWELMGFLVSSRKFARYMTWVILLACGALFLVVLFQNVWTVLEYLFDKLPMA